MKKLALMIMALVMALTLMTGCLGGTQTATVNPDEITVFVDVSAETALTEAAKAYTAMDEHKSASILFNFESSDVLATQITEGAVVDILIAKAEGADALTVEVKAGETTLEAANAFAAYLKTADCAKILADNGVTIG